MSIIGKVIRYFTCSNLTTPAGIVDVEIEMYSSDDHSDTEEEQVVPQKDISSENTFSFGDKSKDQV